MAKANTKSRKRKKDDTADTELVDTFFIDEDDGPNDDIFELSKAKETAEEKRLRIGRVSGCCSIVSGPSRILRS